jgi:hypothetical protein
MAAICGLLSASSMDIFGGLVYRITHRSRETLLYFIGAKTVLAAMVAQCLIPFLPMKTFQTTASCIVNNGQTQLYFTAPFSRRELYLRFFNLPDHMYIVVLNPFLCFQT